MRDRLTYSNVVATLALFLALGGTSYAAISGGFGSGGVLRGCASTRSGALRLVKAGAKCRHGEVLVSWNEKGSQGLTGATGPRGVTGSQGAKGDPGPPGPATGPAGGDLSGTYPNPTIATISGHAPITDATAAGGDFTGSFPNPQIGAGRVSSSDLSANAAYCSANAALLAPTTVGFCSGTSSSLVTKHAGPGVYCLALPIAPVGGAVSVDTLSSGFPVAYMSLQGSLIQTDCGTGYNVLVTTYVSAGGALTDERWYGFFY